MFENLTLTPVSGVVLVLLMIFAGRAFRENWKAQGPNWVLKAWIYGLPAAAAFAALAFIPMQIS